MVASDDPLIRIFRTGQLGDDIMDLHHVPGALDLQMNNSRTGSAVIRDRQSALHESGATAPTVSVRVEEHH